MSSGDPRHRHDEILAKEGKQLDLLLADKTFQQSLQRYRGEVTTHDVAFLAGSSTDGTTVFFDKDFNQAIKQGNVTLKGKPFDPRPFLRVHEAIEGSILRKQFSPGVWVLKEKPDGPEPCAHRIAIIAEKLAVAERLGPDAWKTYDEALRPWIKPDDPKAVKDPPADILRE